MSLVCYNIKMGVVTTNIPGFTTLESLELIDSDTISTTRSVLDCCNGYLVVKLVYGCVVILLVHLCN